MRRLRLVLTLLFIALGASVSTMVRTAETPDTKQAAANAIIGAVVTNNDREVARLLKQGANPNTRLSDSSPTGWRKLVLNVLGIGKMVEIKNDQTLLHLAANRERQDRVTPLLLQRKELNVP